VLGIADAEHEETAPDAAALVIHKLVCSLAGQSQTIHVAPASRAHRAYGQDQATEEFRCSYGLNPAYQAQINAGGLRVSGVDDSGEARIVELPDHRFFIATLFLPQLTSRADAPHPLIVAYLRAAAGH
jgi:CTP synthase (UTP-ammonia lyase)